jgi:hypothetical protein
VIHSKIPAPEDLEYIAYPSPGFFPAPLVHNRWSLSIPGGKFTLSDVHMTDEKGDSIGVLVHPIKNGFGDNTIVWEPKAGSILKYEDEDILYNVEIKHIIKGQDTLDISYQVIVAQTMYPPGCGSDKIWSEEDCRCTQAITTSTFESSSIPKVNVYPNPAKDYINIDFSQITDNQTISIRLINAEGMIIKEIMRPTHQKPVIYVSNLPGGVYQCQVITHDWTETQKVILMD